jgi:hypothetical protein
MGKLIAIVLTVAGAVASTQSFAQGRPYSHTVMNLQCESNCAVDFPAVPAGKVLVIRHLSGVLEAKQNTSTQLTSYGRLLATGTIGQNAQTHHWFLMNGRIEGSMGLFFINSAVSAYVGPGSIPRIEVATTQTASNTLEMTITGELIDR